MPYYSEWYQDYSHRLTKSAFLCIVYIQQNSMIKLTLYENQKESCMQIKNIHLVYFSPCGGTAKVMKKLAAHFNCIEHDLTLPAGRNTKIIFSDTDLVFFGFPVYSGRVPKITEQIFSVLQGKNTPCALVAVYGNREYEGALLDLHEFAQKTGFNTMAAVAAIAQHSISPRFGADRPDSKDEKRLGDFGLQILEQAKNGQSLTKVPGAYPVKKLSSDSSSAEKPAPLSVFADADKCVQCGKCAAVCPSGAIQKNSLCETDNTKCMRCGACVKYCPQNARKFGPQSTVEMINAMLTKTASARKEAELFL